ncbi:MAG: glycosyltransferase [Nitrospirota bacterium]
MTNASWVVNIANLLVRDVNELTNMSENPLVSIIVRTKDRPKLLKRALQSISAQTYRSIEVILVNDGGCDLNVEELKGILGDMALKYIRLEKNTGRPHAGNVGIENAKGEYIGFLDDDDEFYPKHIVTLVLFLEQSDYEVAYTDSLMIYKEYNPETHGLNNDVKREVVFSQDFNYDKLVFENYIPFMCLLFKRKPLVTSGGFDNSFDLYEDWDLLIRIGKQYPFYHIRQVTANYNQWSIDFQISQVHRDPDLLRQAYLKVLSRHIKEITPKSIHGIISDYAHSRQILKNLRTESELHKNLISERDSRIETLSAEVREREAQISTLTTELQAKDSQIETLTVKLQGRDSQIETLTVELQGRDSQIDTLNGELSEKNSRIDALTAEVRERKAQINTLSGELGERDSQINILTVELQGRESQINTLSTELSERDSRIETLSAEVRGKDSRLSTLSSVISGKEAEVVGLKNTVRERESLITTMRNTRGWRMLEKYRRIRDGVFSPLFGGGHHKRNDIPEK